MKKEDYDAYKQKYPELPDYEELDWEFEISEIDKKKFLLRHIRRSMTNKIERLAEILQSILQPDPASFIDLYECRMYNEEDKKNIFEICRKLMHHSRNFMEVALQRDDKLEAEAITAAYKNWKENKEQVIELIKKMKESWTKDMETKEVFRYMG